MFTFLSDYYNCIHCKKFQSNCMEQLVDHGRKCTYYPRPDKFRYKFVCFACSYFTYCKGNINRHVRIHLGDKPYKCSYCDYHSTQSGTMKIHMSRWHSPAQILS